MKNRFPLRTALFRGARILLLVYVALGVLLFFLQKEFLYHPSGAPFGACPELANAEALTLPDGARGYYTPVSETRIAVLYHGNAGSACDRALYAQFFSAQGYSSFIAEYAGYGSDTRGGPSRQKILSDVESTSAFIDERGFETIVLVGKSLGASVAAYHATLSAPDHLVLINATESVAARARELYPLYPVSLLLRENYDTLTWVSAVPETPVTLIHAGEDTLVPASHSRRLHEKLPHKEKTLTVIPDAEHNTLIGFPVFWETISAALSGA